jgi:hypothetical protein
MKPTRTRLVAVAAALSAIAIAAPVSTAAADPVAGQVAEVVGPTIITTAPGVTFVNTNNQTAAGGVFSAGQFAG